MPVVDFASIAKVLPVQAANIGTGPALGALIGAGTRATLYDPTWGYIERFAETSGFEFDDAKTYSTIATFTLECTFTRDAENGSDGSNVTDAASLTELLARFTVLEQMFDTAAQSAAPADFTTWGGALDPRCIPLPSPLADSNGNTVYALPASINIKPGLWPNSISYTATLIEAKFPQQKLMLNGVMLDKGVINITLPAPILFRKRLVGCIGELIQVLNYTCMEMTVSGTTPRQQASGDLIADSSRILSDSLSLGSAYIQVFDKTQGLLPLFPDLDCDGGSGIDVVAEGLEDNISVHLKAVQ